MSRSLPASAVADAEILRLQLMRARWVTLQDLSNAQDHTTWQLILQSEQLTCWLSPRTGAECQVLNVAAAAQAVSEGDISEMDFPGIQGGQESSRAGYNQVNSTVLANHG